MLTKSPSRVPAPQPFVIGIAGGTASGKTTLAQRLAKHLGSEKSVAILSQDDYYKNLAHLSLQDRSNLNFDHPDAIDFNLLVKHLRQLKNNETIQVPKYDFSQHRRLEKSKVINDQKLISKIVVEGTLIFSQVELLKCLHVKIFVDSDADIRLIRRLERDVQERGRTMESILQQYLKTTRPMHRRFVDSTKNQADITISDEDIFSLDFYKLKDLGKRIRNWQ